MTQITPLERSRHHSLSHLLDRISCWRDTDCGSLFPGGTDCAIDLFGRYKRAYSVMDRHYLRRSFSNRQQTTFDRLRPRSAPRHNFREFSDLELASQCEEPSRLFCRENDDHFL